MVREERTGEGGRGEGGGGGEARGKECILKGGDRLSIFPFHFATNFTSLFFQLSTLTEG